MLKYNDPGVRAYVGRRVDLIQIWTQIYKDRGSLEEPVTNTLFNSNCHFMCSLVDIYSVSNTSHDGKLYVCILCSISFFCNFLHLAEFFPVVSTFCKSRFWIGRLDFVHNLRLGHSGNQADGLVCNSNLYVIFSK